VGGEKSLLAATRLDAGFAPRWALADFYFHRRDAAKFWPAMRDALNVSYGDLAEQFRECWSMEADPATTLDRAIPDRPAVQRQYLNFLLSENRLDAAPPVAMRVLSAADREAAPSLLNYCDRMLAQWRGEEARAVWDGLVKRNLVAEPDRGFDLRISTPPGIEAERTASGAILRFSGRQPENAELLSQYIALVPRRRYLFTARYRISGIPPGSGLISALRLPDGRDLPADIAFQAPDGVTLGRLFLAYRRAPGTVRIEGSLTLEKFLVVEVQ